MGIRFDRVSRRMRLPSFAISPPRAHAAASLRGEQQADAGWNPHPVLTLTFYP
jgi:hypothetical protein